MADEGTRQLTEERIPPERQRVELRLDCRYLKQYHEVSVTVPIAMIEGRDAGAIARAFHAEHNRLYGYSLRGRGLAGRDHQRARAGDRRAPTGRAIAARLPASADAGAALKGRRSVYIPERDAFAEVPVYDGHLMHCGHRLEGPALVEQQTTAIFVSESFDCVVDALGSFVLYAKGREDLLDASLARRQEEVTT